MLKNVKIRRGRVLFGDNNVLDHCDLRTRWCPLQARAKQLRLTLTSDLHDPWQLKQEAIILNVSETGGILQQEAGADDSCHWRNEEKKEWSSKMHRDCMWEHTLSVRTHSQYAHTHGTHTSGFCPTFLLPVVKVEWKCFFKSYKTLYTCFLSMKKCFNSNRNTLNNPTEHWVSSFHNS